MNYELRKPKVAERETSQDDGRLAINFLTPNRNTCELSSTTVCSLFRRPKQPESNPHFSTRNENDSCRPFRCPPTNQYSELLGHPLS